MIKAAFEALLTKACFTRRPEKDVQIQREALSPSIRDQVGLTHEVWERSGNEYWHTETIYVWDCSYAPDGFAYLAAVVGTGQDLDHLNLLFRPIGQEVTKW